MSRSRVRSSRRLRYRRIPFGTVARSALDNIGGAAQNLTVTLLVCLPLIGCGSGSMRDLELYAQEVLARKHQSIEPLPTFEPYEIYAYASKEERNPFQPFSQDTQLQPSTVATGSEVHPVPHTPEELEQFPLDSLRMVGTLDKSEQTWAIVLDKQGTVYRVQKGNYMGKNNGKVVHIFEDRIELTEIIPNGTGGWQERQAALALAE